MLLYTPILLSKYVSCSLSINIIINYYFTSYDILIKLCYIEYIFHKHLAHTELNIDLRDYLHYNFKNKYLNERIS